MKELLAAHELPKALLTNREFLEKLTDEVNAAYAAAGQRREPVTSTVVLAIALNTLEECTIPLEELANVQHLAAFQVANDDINVAIQQTCERLLKRNNTGTHPAHTVFAMVLTKSIAAEAILNDATGPFLTRAIGLDLELALITVIQLAGHCKYPPNGRLEVIQAIAAICARQKDADAPICNAAETAILNLDANGELYRIGNNWPSEDEAGARILDSIHGSIEVLAATRMSEASRSRSTAEPKTPPTR